ncbi:LacI family transcriptional regulator [Achromobacter aloeverae]|uniref:LacI family transcriptional regulator n=2 Tax=Achromobacter aloeverae TaxID=1750518 RepID=A0A4Q1HI09_9BURK|nr:LacI family transcriptional regulator [Achromobacter aloeverae]
MATLFLSAALAATPALADDYPSHPITMIVPFAPGGNVDITARVLAPLLTKELGRAIVIENRSGGGGAIGASAVARAPADGYTLMLGSSGSNATVPATNSRVPYDPIKNFTILGGVTTTPSLLVVNPRIPAKTFEDLVKYSLGKPEGLSFGSPGIGSFNHLTLELVKQKSRLHVTHIPYKGAGQAMSDVISGQIDGMFDQSSSSMPIAQEGRIRAIAQLSEHRSPLMPDVPTLAEQGVPGVTAEVYTALFAPAGLPKAVEARLAAALAHAKQDPALRERFQKLGAEVVAMDQVAFLQYATEEAQRWRDLAKANNITTQD